MEAVFPLFPPFIPSRYSHFRPRPTSLSLDEIPVPANSAEKTRREKRREKHPPFAVFIPPGTHFVIQTTLLSLNHGLFHLIKRPRIRNEVPFATHDTVYLPNILHVPRA